MKKILPTAVILMSAISFGAMANNTHMNMNMDTPHNSSPMQKELNDSMN
ncbi:DUF305 domain-containing protein, partial [Staphylococcus warneri]